MRRYSHAMLIRHYLDSDQLAILSPGLAHNRDDGYVTLGRADQSRQGELEGRGNLTDR